MQLITTEMNDKAIHNNFVDWSSVPMALVQDQTGRQRIIGIHSDDPKELIGTTIATSIGDAVMVIDAAVRFTIIECFTRVDTPNDYGTKRARREVRLLKQEEKHRGWAEIAVIVKLPGQPPLYWQANNVEQSNKYLDILLGVIA